MRHLAALCVKATEQAEVHQRSFSLRVSRVESYAPDGILIGQMKMHSAMLTASTTLASLIEGALDLPAMAKGTNLQFNSAEEAEAFRQRQRSLLTNMAEHIAALGERHPDDEGHPPNPRRNLRSQRHHRLPPLFCLQP